MDIKNTNASSITVSPTFGAQASFSSIQEASNFGDNHSQRMLKGINSINMSLSLKFVDLTNQESQDLISFLQKHLKYETQNYTNVGRFDNKRITPFKYQPFFPYKKKDFYCLEFSHEKVYYNVNNISASFDCVSPSILESVESMAGHNSNIDAEISASLGSTSSVSDQNVRLDKGAIIYHPDDYVTAKLNSTFNVNASASATLDASSSFPFPNSTVSCNQTPLRHSIFINNPIDVFHYPYQPIHQDGNLNHKMFDFRPSESFSLKFSPKYRKSTVTEMAQKFNHYGFNPNLSNLQLNFEGRSDTEAKSILLFLESHLGHKKFGFHCLSEYGGNDSDDRNSTPNRKTLSFFYCPEWTHTFNYKNNHSISATFIECLDY